MKKEEEEEEEKRRVGERRMKRKREKNILKPISYIFTPLAEAEMMARDLLISYVLGRCIFE